MKNVLLLIVGSGFLAIGSQTSAQELLATTNQGELVEIDLVAGTATLIGDAGIFNGKDMGWTGLSFDPSGNLFAVSRVWDEPVTGCTASPDIFDVCAHLYRLDPASGVVLAEIGNTQAPYISHIDFASDGTLFGNQWDGQGALITVNPNTAIANIVGHFGSPLENGGLSAHRTTGEIWAIESNFAVDNGNQVSIFEVDVATGAAMPPIVQVGLNGAPVDFGFDSLEILPNGRFIATKARGSSDVYEINPIPHAISGLAEITLIPLVLDAAITGSLNGLDSLTTPVVIDIKPGSRKNRIKPRSRRFIPVAILGSDDFLALQTIISTVRFGPDGAKAIPWLYFAHDINHDGFSDLILFFKTRNTGIECGNTEATIVGETHLGVTFVGTDSIKTVRCH